MKITIGCDSFIRAISRSRCWTWRPERCWRRRAESREEKGGGAGLLRARTGRALRYEWGSRRAGESQWGSERMLTGVGTPVVDRGCSEDSGQLRAEAEDRYLARCRTAAAEASGRGSLSADLDAHTGRAGRKAVAFAPSQAGAHAHAGEEPVAGAGGVEPGRCNGRRSCGARREESSWSRYRCCPLGQPAWRAELLQLLDQLGGADRRAGPCGSRAGFPPQPQRHSG